MSGRGPEAASGRSSSSPASPGSARRRSSRRSWRTRRASDGLRVGQGRCIEHYGAGEAYLPLLEAMTRLCREPGGQHVVRLLRQHAPTWLAQMPSVARRRGACERSQRQTSGVTRERMLRELAEAVEMVAADTPLVLWLEDLHWSDASTLDWLAYLARRPEPARLLVLGTYRPGEALARGHPLEAVKDELKCTGGAGSWRSRCWTRRRWASIWRAGSRRRAARRAGRWRAITGAPAAIRCSSSASPPISCRAAVLVERDGLWELCTGPRVIQVAIPDDVRADDRPQLDRLSAPTSGGSSRRRARPEPSSPPPPSRPRRRASPR